MKPRARAVNPRLPVALALAACACLAPKAADPPELRLELADSFQADDLEGQGHDGPWWQSFGEPALDALILEALHYNHDLAAAAARVRLAASETKAARANLWPTVDLEAGFGRRKVNFIGLPVPGGGGVLSSTNNSVDLGVFVAWEPDLWGRLAARVDAAEADQAAQRADFAGAQLSITGQTAKAWFALREAQLQLALAEDTQGSFGDSERWTRERYRAGVAPPLEVRLAGSDASSSAALVEVRRQELGAARRRMELLLGRYPGNELEQAGVPFGELPPRVPAGVPVQLLSRRPDVVAVELRSLAAGARIDGARGDFYPALLLTADGGLGSNELSDLLGGDFSVWGLAARLVAPLFDGGSRRASLSAAEALRDEALAIFAGTLLAACFEVENALDAEGYLEGRTLHLERAYREAAAAAELASFRYRAGLVGVITLLDSQRREFNTRSELLRGQLRLFENRVDLHLALGGGFEAGGGPGPVDGSSDGSGDGDGGDSNADHE